MQLSDKELIEFQEKILSWYAQHQRDLPWRQTRDPYRILISEVMSQQTQIQRVIVKYTAWLESFPTVQSLASAKVSDVLALWSGLGYNRRALHLKKTAEIVTEKYSRKFPETEKELLALPGIGQYTSRALLCFAFNQQIAVVDTNVRKVILTQVLKNHSGEQSDSKILQISDSGQARMTTEKEIEAIAQRLLPQGKAYEWNQALMDYAGAVLKKEKISIPKQSKFIGSHRYYRGQVLKSLLQQKKIAVQDMGLLIKKDFTKDDSVWLQKLLKELSDEGFILVKNDLVSLAS